MERRGVRRSSTGSCFLKNEAKTNRLKSIFCLTEVKRKELAQGAKNNWRSPKICGNEN
jgi:hypothetical protein